MAIRTERDNPVVSFALQQKMSLAGLARNLDFDSAQKFYSYKRRLSDCVINRIQEYYGVDLSEDVIKYKKTKRAKKRLCTKISQKHPIIKFIQKQQLSISAFVKTIDYTKQSFYSNIYKSESSLIDKIKEYYNIDLAAKVKRFLKNNKL